MRKAVLVTGVAGGLGFALAKSFIKNGYEVFGLDIASPKEKLDGLTFIQTDLTLEESVNHAFEVISKENVKFDSLINAAGIYELNSLIEMSEKDFVKVFDVNVFAMYRINKTFLPLLNDGGKIIMVSSELAPLDSLPFTGIYGISKTLIEKYADSLRSELQLLGYQVVVIRPGAIDTGLLDVSTAKLDKFTEQTTHYSYNAKKFKKIVNSVESKKVSPDKVASLIYKVSQKKKTRYVYKINRNKMLLLLNALPKRRQNKIIGRILKK